MADVEQTETRVLALARKWYREADTRIRREALDGADFEALAETGFTLTGVPVAAGGLFTDLAGCIRPYARMIEALAGADPSLALVASMHPVVLGYWLGAEPHACGARWEAQRESVYASARSGAFWGTATSEPGSGGDILRTRARAVRDGAGFRFSGEKHFASGSGICGFMITTARDGEHDEPPVFVLDLREIDGSRGGPGMTLTHAWDGYGMRATQSHGWRFEDFPAQRHAAPGACVAARPLVAQLSAVLFSAVILAVVEQAVAAARKTLVARAEALRPAERTGWVAVENQGWLARQAFSGMLAAVEGGEGLRACARGKLVIAELAESTMLELGRVLGGSSYARSRPYGQWLQDVRALGFLRPPWALAVDQLFELDCLAAAGDD